MTPPMYERLEAMFSESGLCVGYDVQMLFFEDPKDENISVMLFRPNGGAPLRNDLGAEHYVTVDVIGARTRKRETTNHAQRILDYVQANPMPFPCLGYVQSMGGLPAPMPTEEGRIVYRLAFVCTYGE